MGRRRFLQIFTGLAAAAAPSAIRYIKTADGIRPMTMAEMVDRYGDEPACPAARFCDSGVMFQLDVHRPNQRVGRLHARLHAINPVDTPPRAV